jgi:CRISPR system Cascade subunit CasA
VNDLAYFSVLEEPWIPVIDLNGKRKELGILDTLAQAHQIKEVADTIPSYEYGVFRFLCTFLMDVYRPKDWETLQDLYELKSFDMEEIQNYIEQCKKEGVSFDLFDKKRPFLQTAYNEEYDKNLGSVAALNISMPSGNNHIHFEHRKEQEQSMTYAEAARGLCALNLFCAAAAQGYPSTINGAPPIYFVYDGSNLFESLIYSMIAVKEGGETSYDSPPVFWRNQSEVIPKQTEASTSILYGMLYPCRRVLLYPEEDGTVKKMYLCQGKNYVAYDSWRDPHVSYLFSDKGRNSLKPTIEKEPWRNIVTILSDSHENRTAPIFVHRILRKELVDEVSVIAYSIVTNKASYLDMQKSHLKMPRSIAVNETKRDRVQDIIQAVEEMSDALGKSINGCFLVTQQKKSNKLIHRSVSEIQSKFLQRCRDYILQDVFHELATIPEKEATAYTDKYLEKLGKYCRLSFQRAANELFSSIRELKEQQKMRSWLNFQISKARGEEKKK